MEGEVVVPLALQGVSSVGLCSCQKQYPAIYVKQGSRLG